MLNDAASHALFAAYIVSYQPESILCSHVIDRDQLIGVIYLENNLAPGAFSPERLQVLKVLTSQVAIALENARLYADAGLVIQFSGQTRQIKSA